MARTSAQVGASSIFAKTAQPYAVTVVTAKTVETTYHDDRDTAWDAFMTAGRNPLTKSVSLEKRPGLIEVETGA